MESEWKHYCEISASEAKRRESVIAHSESGRQEVCWDGRTFQWRTAGGEVATTEGVVTFYAIG